MINILLDNSSKVSADNHIHALIKALNKFEDLSPNIFFTDGTTVPQEYPLTHENYIPVGERVFYPLLKQLSHRPEPLLLIVSGTDMKHKLIKLTNSRNIKVLLLVDQTMSVIKVPKRLGIPIEQCYAAWDSTYIKKYLGIIHDALI